MALTVNLIGPGRLGRSVGRMLAGCPEYRLLALHGPDQLEEARVFIGAGETVSSIADLPPAALWLLAVPDGAIASVAAELAEAGVVPAGTVVAHFSGAGEAELLAPLRQCGATLGSLHPVYSFADPLRAVEGFAGTACAIEGDKAACQELEKLAVALAGRPFRLTGSKAAYHAALCIASNYLVTLAALAETTAGVAGITAAQSLPLISGLMRQTLANIASLGPAAALTGPIVRGDAGTVASHLAALAEHPALLALYRPLGQATVELAGSRLTPTARAALLAALAPASVDQ